MSDAPARWPLVDRAFAAYAAVSSLYVLAAAPALDGWIWHLAARLALIATIALLPPRGATWEGPLPGEPGWRRAGRRVLAVARHAWPLPAALGFFEETPALLAALWGPPPWWFERALVGLDRALFGAAPAAILARWSPPAVVEAMSALYFAYYPILGGGLAIAWLARGRGRPPGPAFEPAVTGMSLGFLASFLLFPLLPARGPWHLPAVAGLPPLAGGFFTRVMARIQGLGGIVGGAFPSAHVAAAWGLVVGMGGRLRRWATVLGALAAGMSVACVWLRYHHPADVVAGLGIGVLAGALARRRAR